MKIFNVYSIAGLFYELYSPNIDHFTCTPLTESDANPLYRINGLFWAKLLSEASLKYLIEKIKCNIDESSDIEQAVIANEDLFVSLVTNAPLKIINQKISEQEMFTYMEQIEIACKLFSKYIYSPFVLSIQDGFLEPTMSIKELLTCVENKEKNPYISFLEGEVYPLLCSISTAPSLVWINGQPRISSLSIAKKLKELYPSVVIALRYHSSEYFSLNKIDELLQNNKSLFSIIDCIVLDDSIDTCTQIEKAVECGDLEFHDCNNIVFYSRQRKRIIKSSYAKVKYSFSESVHIRSKGKKNNSVYIAPHSVMNLKFNPNTACYWNKCTFCAINKKYKFINNIETEPIDKKIRYIKDCISQGVKYLWFEDEALPPEQLDLVASYFLQAEIDCIWQVRSRIDCRFSRALALKLYKAGLREIRFGLESASYRILKLMNKFPEEVSLNTVESIVKYCTEAGIHVHFPMIVGFPTETIEERIETYKFLMYLRETYKKVSYNINVLMLDIASDLFRNFHKYNISQISFPCSPYDFLGNMINFTCDDMGESRESIDYKRNEFMRETLFPWMPKNSHIKPNIYYRLSETIRNTLVWHSSENDDIKQTNPSDVCYISTQLSVWKSENQLYIKIYNWINHRMFKMSNDDYRLLCSLDNMPYSVIINSELGKAFFSAGLLETKSSYNYSEN